MFDAVPLARARREVTDRDREAGAIGESLQFPLPEPESRAVAAPRVRCDHERPSRGIGRPTHPLPPAADGVHGEARRIMIDPDAHPAFVAVQIIDAVRDGLPSGGRRGGDCAASTTFAGWRQLFLPAKGQQRSVAHHLARPGCCRRPVGGREVLQRWSADRRVGASRDAWNAGGQRTRSVHRRPVHGVESAA